MEKREGGLVVLPGLFHCHPPADFVVKQTEVFGHPHRESSPNASPGHSQAHLSITIITKHVTLTPIIINSNIAQSKYTLTNHRVGGWSLEYDVIDVT